MGTCGAGLSTRHQRKHIIARHWLCTLSASRARGGRRLKAAYSWTAVLPWRLSLHWIDRKEMLGFHTPPRCSFFQSDFISSSEELCCLLWTHTVFAMKTHTLVQTQTHILGAIQRLKLWNTQGNSADTHRMVMNKCEGGKTFHSSSGRLWWSAGVAQSLALK